MLGRADDLREKSVTADADASSSQIIESGDFRIDLLRRSVTLRGKELDLTPEEFDVMVFLAGHPQSVITPHTRLTTNWTTDRVRQTEFLRVLVSLRSKLDAAGHGKHYLRTELWVVYRFDPTSSSAA